MLDNDDRVEVIRHHDERVQPNFSLNLSGQQPFLGNDLPSRGELHLPVRDVTETQFAVHSVIA
jgi:hypothetical protein